MLKFCTLKNRICDDCRSVDSWVCYSSSTSASKYIKGLQHVNPFLRAVQSYSRQTEERLRVFLLFSQSKTEQIVDDLLLMERVSERRIQTAHTFLALPSLLRRGIMRFALNPYAGFLMYGCWNEFVRGIPFPELLNPCRYKLLVGISLRLKIRPQCKLNILIKLFSKMANKATDPQ